MRYRLVPFTTEWEPATVRANIRFRDSKVVPYLLPGQASPEEAGGPVRRQHWLVVDADDEVRGGCLLQSQRAWVDGEETDVVNVQSPLSEGLADRRHAGLAPWLLKELVRRYTFTYSIGMGGEDAPYARLLRALGWRVEPAPFYFRVLAGRLFLAHMQPLRNHPKLGQVAAAGAAIPLLPDIGFTLLHAWRTRKPRQEPTASKTSPDWTNFRVRYGFAVDRTPTVLDYLYPSADRNTRRITTPGAFGLLRVSAFRGHVQFGDLVVVTLVEAFCQPGSEHALFRAVVEEAKGAGAALVVTNQTAPELGQALTSAGWLSYTSNYMVALSPPLAGRVGSQPIYVNRGDGDGLLNL